MPFADLGLLGTGLIGTSIGLAARKAGMRAAGYDACFRNAQEALAAGGLDAIAVREEELAEADVLVLATPLDATLRALERMAGKPPRSRLVIDVASLQLPVLRAGGGLPAFVPTHPIAGSERSGPEAARPDLFAGKAWIYEPAADRDSVERARSFIAALGARPIPLDSAEHDRIVALTSHLPQLAAVALGALLGPALAEPAVGMLCGTGIRGAIRLGASPWTMWRPILACNAPAAARHARELAAALQEFAQVLEAENSDALAPYFTTAARAVAALGNDELRARVPISEADAGKG